MNFPVGSPVYREPDDQPIGYVLDPEDPAHTERLLAEHGGGIGQIQIISETGDRTLWTRRGKRPVAVTFRQAQSMHQPRFEKLWRPDVPRDNSPLAWLGVRDSLASFLKDPELRRSLCELGEWSGVPREVAYQTVPQLAPILLRATVVVWTEDRWEAAISGSDAFEDTMLQPGDSYGGPELWLFEQGPILEPPNLGLERSCQVLGMLVVGSRLGASPRGPDGVSWFTILAPELPPEWQGTHDVQGLGPLAEDPANWMPRFKGLPGIAYGQPILPYAAPLVAASKFMRLPFIERRVEPLPRQQGRQYQRKHPEHSTLVQTITLRRTQYEYERKGEAGAVEWNCHWWSGDHWVHPRHERYRSSEPFYRRGCWKGDPDKPMKPPGERIYRVRK